MAKYLTLEQMSFPLNPRSSASCCRWTNPNSVGDKKSHKPFSCDSGVLLLQGPSTYHLDPSSQRNEWRKAGSSALLGRPGKTSRGNTKSSLLPFLPPTTSRGCGGASIALVRAERLALALGLFFPGWELTGPFGSGVNQPFLSSSQEMKTVCSVKPAPVMKSRWPSTACPSCNTKRDTKVSCKCPHDTPHRPLSQLQKLKPTSWLPSCRQIAPKHNAKHILAGRSKVWHARGSRRTCRKSAPWKFWSLRACGNSPARLGGPASSPAKTRHKHKNAGRDYHHTTT